MTDIEAERTMEEAAAEIERLLGVCKDKTVLLNDAYDEIERLRGIEQFVSEASQHERDGLRAEIERLRAINKQLKAENLPEALAKALGLMDVLEDEIKSLRAKIEELKK